MGGGQSVIKQGEDIKNKHDAGDIDLSLACLEDAICPPAKFIPNITKFTNKYDNNDGRSNRSNFKYILIFFLLLLFIIIIKKYI
jgi:hypothetical protein